MKSSKLGLIDKIQQTELTETLRKIDDMNIDYDRLSDVLGFSDKIAKYSNLSNLDTIAESALDKLGYSAAAAAIANPDSDIGRLAKAMEVPDRTGIFSDFVNLQNAALRAFDQPNITDGFAQRIAKVMRENDEISVFDDLMNAQNSAIGILDKLKIPDGFTAEVMRANDQVSAFDDLMNAQNSAVDIFGKLNISDGLAQRMATMISANDRASAFDRLIDTESIAISAFDRLRINIGIIDPPDFNIDSVEAINDSVISVDGEPVDLVEINNVFSNISKNSESLEEFIRQILSWIDGLSGVVKFIATNYFFEKILLSLIIGTILINYQTILCVRPECKETEPRAATKQIIQETNDTHPHYELDSFRVVTAESGLVVRTIGNRKGERIGGLPFGSRVMLITKARSWSLVDYFDPETNEFQQGWVFSIHLKKFN